MALDPTLDLFLGELLNHDHHEVADLDVRVTNIENEYKIKQIWLSVSGTTGTIALPKIGGGSVDTSKYDIYLDEYPGGWDAIITQLDGEPKELYAYDSSGQVVTVTLGGAGNRDYTLSAAPTGYPVALCYFIRIKALYLQEVDPDYIFEREDALPAYALDMDAWWYALTL